jgi:hypothetical protein
MFVQRGNAIGVALLAALLGRFLPRLGPLRATEAASFFLDVTEADRHSAASRSGSKPWAVVCESFATMRPRSFFTASKRGVFRYSRSSM